MANFFDTPLPIPKEKHSWFDLETNYKSSFNIGQLVPACEPIEVLPGDNFDMSSEVFVRLAPMTFPIMHRIKIRLNYFYCPNRLIFGERLSDLFQKGDVDIPYFLVNKTSLVANSLYDYLGFQPVPVDYAESVVKVNNLLPLYMYNLIWATYYADGVLDSNEIQSIKSAIDNYQSSMLAGTPILIDQAGYSVSSAVRNVSYTKDYFTSAESEPQQGNDVSLFSPLRFSGVTDFREGNVTEPPYFRADDLGSEGGVPLYYTNSQSESKEVGIVATIRDLWQKMATQRWFNRNAVYGDRYNEQIAGHYGVVNPDYRINMPYYIGGSQAILQIREVLQTSATTDDSPLGAQAGKGISLSRTNHQKFHVPEHGFIMPLISLVPDNGYTTGNPNWSFKSNVFDFATPEFANIAEQAIRNGEIFASYDDDEDNEDFAYQIRYGEYRSLRNIATGDFRDTTLSSWHLNRMFTELPSFNKSFIEADPDDTTRIFADADSADQHVFVDIQTQLRGTRCLPHLPNPDKL